MRLRFKFFGETGAFEQFAHQCIKRSHGGQVQPHIHQPLLPPARARQQIHPDKTAVRQHALLEREQAAIVSKNRAVGQP